MGRYEPLRAFLSDQVTDRLSVTFRDIEEVIGRPLPASKCYPAWWSNNPSNNPMTKVWLEAGFVTEQVDVPGGRLTFRRARPANASRAPRPPIFGCMQGSVTVAPGVDLTEPADPEWGRAST